MDRPTITHGPLRDRIVAVARDGDRIRLRELYEETLTLEPADESLTTLLAGEIARHEGSITEAKQLLQKAAAMFEEQGEKRLLAEATRKIAGCLWAAGYVDEAEETALRAIEMHEAQGDRLGVAMTRNGLASIYHSRTELAQAFRQLMQAVDILEDLDERRQLADSYGDLATIYTMTGQFEKGQEFFHRSIDIAEQLGAVEVELTARYNLAILHFDLGDVPRARSEYEQIIVKADEAGLMFRKEQSMIALAYCELSELDGPEDPVAAEKIIREILAMDLDERTRATEAQIQIMLAELVARQHRFDEALKILDTWQEAARSNIPKYIRSCYLRAMISKLSGDLQTARDHFQTALDLSIQHELPGQQVLHHRILRDLARDLQDFEAYVMHNDAMQEIEKDLQLQETSRKVALQEQERRIATERQERERERAVLYSTLPAHIADRVIRGEDVSGDDIEEAAVLFMDIVGFTTLSSSMTPRDVTILLDEVFSVCDTEVARYGVTRIKTIGDSYMAVAFPDIESPSPARRAVQAAVAIRERLAETKPDITVRIGIHVGPVVAGVIGREHVQYDVWGDTVNMASRMESTAEPGKIQVTEAVASLSQEENPPLVKRGPIDVKGKGPVVTYWVEPS